MVQNWRDWGWQFGLVGVVVLGGTSVYPSHAAAQITPDATLGAENSAIAPGGATVDGLPVDLIEQGAKRGASLFHSFAEFNINEGQRVYFANPDGIATILSRVTGTNPSEILGTLGVLGQANLLFLNPHGIIFGENARLDIAGSFVASTADRWQLDGGFAFSASEPEAPPLLTLNVTPGLQYGTAQQGAIVNRGNLAVGQDLTLAGNHLNLSGRLQAGQDLTLYARDSLQVRDSSTQPAIATAGQQLLVRGDRAVDIFALAHPESGFFAGGDLVLRSGETVGGDGRYSAGGSFRIERLDGGLGQLSSPYDPIIRANGDVSLASYLGASLHILAGGSVTIPGGVEVTGADPGNAIAETVTLSDGTALAIDGNIIPTLDIRAGIDWQTLPGNTINGVVNPAPTFGNATSAGINLGPVTVAPGGTVFVSNQYQPNPALSGDIQLTGIQVEGGSLTVDTRGGIALDGVANTSAGLAEGGRVTFLADGDISLSPNAAIFADGLVGGAITLNSGANLAVNGGIIQSITLGTGVGNDINLAAESITLDGGGVLASLDFGARGQSGSINVTTGSLSMINGAFLVADTLGEGDAGNVAIEATGAISLDGDSVVVSAVAPPAMGQGGDITIATESLALTDGSQLLALALGQGDAGNIVVRARDFVSFDGVSASQQFSGAVSFVEVGAVGDGGDITIATGSLALTNGALLRADTFSEGNAGNVTIAASDTVLLQGVDRSDGDVDSDTLAGGIVSEVFTGAIGRGGNINLEAGSLAVTNGAIISASTGGEGEAGDVTIRAANDIVLDGAVTNFNSGIFVETQGDFPGGNLNIAANSLAVTNGAEISASTLAEGDAGSVAIAAQTISLDGTSDRGASGIFSRVETEASGQGGNLAIAAQTLSLSNGAQIAASTEGTPDADAGNIEISLGRVTLDSGSQISAATSGGAGGDITVEADMFEATGGGQLLTTTSGSREAGDITLEVIDSITLTGEGTGLFANTTPNSTGQGGSILIDPRTVAVRDGARIAVGSEGAGEGGQIEIEAGSLILDNGGLISAETLSTQGGDISLQLQDALILRRGSRISTTAGTAQAGGDGGDIAIATDFIVAVPEENSDITANAFEGRGGNIDITAQGIFGIEFREQLTPLSDITASSEFGIDGVVEIDEPEVDPSEGVVDLPTQPVDATQLVARTCPADAGENPLGEFVITGRGGLPASPEDTLSVPALWQDLRPPSPPTAIRPSREVESEASDVGEIVEAQGWRLGKDGRVILTASATRPTPSRTQSMPVTCPSPTATNP